MGKKKVPKESKPKRWPSSQRWGPACCCGWRHWQGRGKLTHSGAAPRPSLPGPTLGCWDLLKPECLEPVLRDKRSSHNEKPTHSKEDPVQPKINKNFFLKFEKQRIKQMWAQASEGFRDRMGRWRVREPS